MRLDQYSSRNMGEWLSIWQREFYSIPNELISVHPVLVSAESKIYHKILETIYHSVSIFKESAE